MTNPAARYCTECPSNTTRLRGAPELAVGRCWQHLHPAGSHTAAPGVARVPASPPVVALADAATAVTVADARADYTEAAQLAVATGEAVARARTAWLASARAERGGPPSETTQRLHDAHAASWDADTAAIVSAHALHNALFVAEASDQDAARAVLAAQSAYLRAHTVDRATCGPAKDAYDDACDAFNKTYNATQLGPRSERVRIPLLRYADTD